MSLQRSNTKGTSAELTEIKKDTRVTFDKPEKEINALHYDIKMAIVDAANTYVKKAIQIGDLLHKTKENLPHGDFQKWVESNLDFSYKNATRYMVIFKHKEKVIEQGYESIRQALQFIKGENDDDSDTTKELFKKLEQAFKEKDNSILNKSERKILLNEFEKKEERLKSALAEIKKRKSFLE